MGGEIGTEETTRKTADLVEIEMSIFKIEGELRGRQRTNPPAVFQLSMRLRNPDAWDSRAIDLIQQILLLLGNARWEIEFHEGRSAKVPKHESSDKNRIKQVALFSGGMDSTCGLVSLQKEHDSTRL